MILANIILQAWPGSVPVIEGATVGDTLLPSALNPYILYFLIILTIAGIMMLNRIAEAVGASLKLVEGGVNLKEVLNSSYSNSSILLSLILLVPFYAFVFYYSKISALGYWWILATFAAYFVYKVVMLRITSWITGKKEVFSFVGKTSNGTFFLIMALSIVALLVAVLWKDVPEIALETYLLATAGFLVVLYSIRVYKFFIAANFSVFFRFLYLCALEFLPLVVVVKVVVLNGN